jgi:hypothetical protein
MFSYYYPTSSSSSSYNSPSDLPWRRYRHLANPHGLYDYRLETHNQNHNRYQWNERKFAQWMGGIPGPPNGGGFGPGYSIMGFEPRGAYMSGALPPGFARGGLFRHGREYF